MTETDTSKLKVAVMRNEKGQLLPGFTANSLGKPKGARRLSTLMKEAIEKIADGDDEPADVLIVRKVIQMAMRGDLRAIEMIFDRIDGKAPQAIAIQNENVGLSEDQRKKLDNMLDMKLSS